MEEIMNRSESSIEVTRNSKNNFQFSLKVYGDDVEKITKIAVDKAKELNEKIPFGD